MQTALLSASGGAQTFLVHLAGGGFGDTRFVVEHFLAYVAQRIMLRR